MATQFCGKNCQLYKRHERENKMCPSCTRPRKKIRGCIHNKNAATKREDKGQVTHIYIQLVYFALGIRSLRGDNCTMR